MSLINLADPAIRAEAIASGLVWSGPVAAQVAACRDIEAGRVPIDPDKLPDHALRLLDALAVYPRRPWTSVASYRVRVER